MALVVGWGFIGVGLFVWSRNPGNRVGSLMTATGFAWFFTLVGFSNLAVFFTLGAVFGSVYLAVAIHMLLAAPTGRVERRGDRNLVAFGYLLTTVLIVPLFFFVDAQRDFDCGDCPENLLQIWDNQTLVDVLSAAVNVAGARDLRAGVARAALAGGHRARAPAVRAAVRGRGDPDDRPGDHGRRPGARLG